MKGQNSADLNIDTRGLRYGDRVAVTVIGRISYVGFGEGNDENDLDRCVTLDVEEVTDLAPVNLKILDGDPE